MLCFGEAVQRLAFAQIREIDPQAITEVTELIAAVLNAENGDA